MTTPSTRVTGHPGTDPNSALCDIADQKICNSQMLDLHMCRWLIGRIFTCHAGDDAGSIFHVYAL